MRWTSLKNELLTLQSQPCVWPLDLSVEMKKKHEEHNKLVFERLFSLLILPDEIREDRIQQFLSMRDKLIAAGSGDYTFNPNLPANLACLKVQAFLAKEKTVCEMLMPSVRKIMGSGFLETDFKNASEDENNQFVLCYFLRTEAGDLVHARNIFSFVEQKTDRLFLKSNTPDYFELTSMDHERLKKIAGADSEAYFNVLKLKNLLEHQEKPSVGQALKELIVALLESSVKDAGTDSDENIEKCAIPIKTFHKQWILLADKEKIADYTANGSPWPLYSHLLPLFAGVRGIPGVEDIQLTMTDIDRIKHEKIIPCTQQIGLQLRYILDKHSDLFLIPLFGKEYFFKEESSATIKAELEKLSVLSAQYELALPNRLPLLGDDQQFMICESLFYVMSKQLVTLHQPRFSSRFHYLSPFIKTMGDFGVALFLSPNNQWQDLFRNFKITFVKMLGHKRNFVFNIAYLLKMHRSSEWQDFFNALDDVGLSNLLDSDAVGNLLSQFSQKQWPALTNALYPVVKLVIKSGSDIILLIKEQITADSEKILSLFSDTVRSVLSKEGQLENIFKISEATHYSSIISICYPLIKKKIKNDKKFLLDALFSIPSLKRICFIVLMEKFFDDIKFTADYVKSILNLLDQSEWADLFNCITAQRLMDCFKTAVEFEAFLVSLNAGNDRLHCILALRNNMPVFSIDPIALNSLVQKFPKCEMAILELFRPCIILILSDFLTSFKMADLFCRPIFSEEKHIFEMLFEKALPIILSKKNLLGMRLGDKTSPGLFGLPEAYAVNIIQELTRIENEMIKENISKVNASYQKLEILSIFMQKSETGEFPKDSIFYSHLSTHFGKNFFLLIPRYMKRFENERSLGIPLFEFVSTPSVLPRSQTPSVSLRPLKTARVVSVTPVTHPHPMRFQFSASTTQRIQRNILGNVRRITFTGDAPAWR